MNLSDICRNGTNNLRISTNSVPGRLFIQEQRHSHRGEQRTAKVPNNKHNERWQTASTLQHNSRQSSIVKKLSLLSRCEI